MRLMFRFIFREYEDVVNIDDNKFPNIRMEALDS
jgi:hypothetical protein